MSKKFLLILSFSFISTLACFGQPEDPATDPDNPVPITGLEVLIGMGAWLGARKLWRYRLEERVSYDDTDIK